MVPAGLCIAVVLLGCISFCFEMDISGRVLSLLLMFFSMWLMENAIFDLTMGGFTVKQMKRKCQVPHFYGPLSGFWEGF